MFDLFLPHVDKGQDAPPEWTDALLNYFRVVIEDGDQLNDWLTHLPDWLRPWAVGAGSSYNVCVNQGCEPLLVVFEFADNFFPDEVIEAAWILISWIQAFGA